MLLLIEGDLDMQMKYVFQSLYESFSIKTSDDKWKCIHLCDRHTHMHNYAYFYFSYVSSHNGILMTYRSSWIFSNNQLNEGWLIMVIMVMMIISRDLKTQRFHPLSYPPNCVILTPTQFITKRKSTLYPAMKQTKLLIAAAKSTHSPAVWAELHPH